MPRPLPPGLILTYYGDDFTGSTDTAEVLTFAGIPTVLFFDEVRPAWMERFPECRAAGVAGISRSQSPEWMAANLPPVFGALRDLGGAICHYKVCSTFDSSPRAGSIGRATEIGHQVFGTPTSPVIVGAPALGRYVAFGNLFAAAGSENYRLDRHPTMSRHPVTPMEESDIRRILGRQTEKTVALFDYPALLRPDFRGRYAGLLAQRPDMVLIDTLDAESMARAGELVWEFPGGPDPVFMPGSSGLEYALVAYWRRAGLLAPPTEAQRVGEVERIVVASGSCSPATGQQIATAMDLGFTGIRLDARAVAEGGASIEAVAGQALAALETGRSVVLYSAQGPDDPEVLSGDSGLSQNLGRGTGIILREVLLRSGVRRAVVAGGDTSGHAGQQLGIAALTILQPMTPGAPLCRAWADGPLDGLEIVFKGGQRGEPDFFETVRQGGAPASL